MHDGRSVDKNMENTDKNGQKAYQVFDGGERQDEQSLFEFLRLDALHLAEHIPVTMRGRRVMGLKIFFIT